MMKKTLSLLLILSLLLSLVACKSASPSKGEQSPSLIRSFTDDAGRQVELPQEIQKIVPSAPLAQIVLLTLAPEMFVGLASEAKEAERGILPDVIFSLPYFGSLYAGAELNVEELARSAPDLIIDMGEVKPSTKEDLDALQQQTTIPCVFISLSLENMGQTYRTLGKLLGKEERAEELAQFCEKVYSRTLSIMEKVGDNKTNCLYVLGQEGLNVIAAGSYHAELLDLLTNNLAVVDNPLSKGSGNQVTMEQISLWNPDFVIFGPDSIYSSVKELSPWNQVSAITQDRYVEVPQIPNNWMSMPPSVQRYLGLIWLPSVLYPEYCDYNAQAEIAEFFRLFYGCTLTPEQYESITANAFLE